MRLRRGLNIRNRNINIHWWRGGARQRGDKIRGDWYWVAAHHHHYYYYYHHRQHIRLDYGGTKWVSGYTTPSPLLIQLILTLAQTQHSTVLSTSTVSPIWEQNSFSSFFICRIGPRVQGQTVLIQIPLCCCVTNNPIQSSHSLSLSPDQSPANLYTPGEGGGRFVWTYLDSQ